MSKCVTSETVNQNILFWTISQKFAKMEVFCHAIEDATLNFKFKLY